MQKYDVVLMLDAGLSDSERKTLLQEVEKSLGDGVEQRDEIGLRVLTHDLGGKRGQDKVYLYSFYLQAAATNITQFKKQRVYNKSIKKIHIYKMTPTQPFFMFAPLQEELEKVIEGWDAKKLGQKLVFFTDKRNTKYINRKSAAMLKKYMTRFGDIKPRKYTGNSVSVQKKLREAVLRARELGLLQFTKK